MKKPFNLDSWLADKSQKVVTRDGRTARIICTDAKGSQRNDDVIVLIGGELGSENIYRYYYDGTLISKANRDKNSRCDLFLITEEPELTEFEQRIEMHLAYAERGMHDSNDIQDIKDTAKELLDLARKQIEKEMLAEASDDSEQLDNLIECYYGNIPDDSDKIKAAKHFYNLGKLAGIKQCAPLETDWIKDLQDEKGYDRLEKVYQQGIHYGKNIGKAEALKDLPKWKKTNVLCTGLCQFNGLPLSVYHEGYRIELSDLEKLPKED